MKLTRSETFDPIALLSLETETESESAARSHPKNRDFMQMQSAKVSNWILSGFSESVLSVNYNS